MANFVADFETFVPDKKVLERLDRKLHPKDYLLPKDIETYVWGWGFTEVGNVSDDKIMLGSGMDSFITECYKHHNPVIYFHNLKFDGHFIMAWALRNGYTYSDKKTDMTMNVIISKMNMFYQIELIKERRNKSFKKLVFRDSLKKLPFSVDRIGKGFGLDHKKLDVEEEFYLIPRCKDHILTDLEKEYIRNDIRVVSQALQIQFHQGLTKMTNGSDALNDFKNIIGHKQFENYFPILSIPVNAEILLAYRGGFTYSDERFRGIEHEEGLVYDVNSLYPSVMYYEKMPYGMPLFFRGQYKPDKLFDLYIQELSCEFKLKPNHIPTIQVRHQIGKYNPREYLKESKGITKLHLTNVDLELFFDHYDVYNIEYHCGYKFRSHTDIFKDYIDKWTVIKMENTGAIRELAKLMLNSLYGKFATNPDVTGKYVELEDEVVKLKLGDQEMRDPVYTAVGVFTTAYGRDVTIRTAQENYHRFAYADTDSVHLIGLEKPNIKIDPLKLGYWKLEGQFTWAKFLGAKCYVEEIDGDLKVTVAGMPRNMHKMVTKENFDIGLKLNGKKMPTVVNGGVVLVDYTYDLKIRNFYS